MARPALGFGAYYALSDRFHPARHWRDFLTLDENFGNLRDFKTGVCGSRPRKTAIL